MEIDARERKELTLLGSPGARLFSPSVLFRGCCLLSLGFGVLGLPLGLLCGSLRLGLCCSSGSSGVVGDLASL